jgi:dethiobiotin synthetase
VVGTDTEVGKTWVSARILTDLRAAGFRVAARKPAQSFEPDDDPAHLDAAVLGAASGESAEVVCPPHRWYEVAMAPVMAASALGRPPFTIQDLVSEIHWPATSAGPGPNAGAVAGAGEGPDASADPVEVGLVETAGGLRSPLAADGDCLALCRALEPDVVLLVADAGLGTINAVRLTLDGLGSLASRTALVLNRFDAGSDLHQRNVEWLTRHDGLQVLTVPGEGTRLLDVVRGEAPAAEHR